jgi:hypothetical protein
MPMHIPQIVNEDLPYVQGLLQMPPLQCDLLVRSQLSGTSQCIPYLSPIHLSLRQLV